MKTYSTRELADTGRLWIQLPTDAIAFEFFEGEIWVSARAAESPINLLADLPTHIEALANRNPEITRSRFYFDIVDNEARFRFDILDDKSMITADWCSMSLLFPPYTQN